MKRIYLDYAASAPLSPEVREVINQFTRETGAGNPSSLHAEGRSMQARLDRAHTTVGSVFGYHPTEVIFTSGATESNNLVIRGVLRAWRRQTGEKPHVVLSAIEHPSWRQTILAEDADVTIVPVSRQGVVSAPDILQAIGKNTALVGCMYVNNEIGTIQPIAAIGKGIESLRGDSPWPVFHVDGVQAFPYLNMHHGHTHADTMTISGHKYGALGGIGAVFIKKKVPLESITRGGGQEWGYRAGTENVLGAITLAEAVDRNDAHRDHLLKHTQELQEHLENLLPTKLPDLTILGQAVARAPHITYLWLPGVIDEHIVHKLDLLGVAVSSGSACSSGATLPSSTLLALGFSEEEAFGGLRISYGRFTTKKELDEFVDRLKQGVR